jgi:hypothetical protein
MRHAAASAAAVLAFAAAPAALAAGPGLGTAVALADGDVSYVTAAGDTSTTLDKRARSDGRVLERVSVRGSWGVPRVTIDGDVGGVSHDRRVLVLAQATHPNRMYRLRTDFLALDTRTLKVMRTIRLKGDFGFDALRSRRAGGRCS